MVAVAQQPAWRLGHPGAERHPDQCRNGAEAENQPPVQGPCTARKRPQNDQRDDEGRQDAHRDHPLLEDTQRSTPATGSVLGDVGRGDRRVRADSQADERPRHQQHGRVRRDRRQDRAQCVDERVDDKQGLAAEPVRKSAGGERADRSAEGCARDQVAKREAVQCIRNKWQRRADVGRVVSEEEATDGRKQGQRPVERGRHTLVKLGQNVPAARLDMCSA